MIGMGVGNMREIGGGGHKVEWRKKKEKKKNVTIF